MGFGVLLKGTMAPVFSWDEPPDLIKASGLALQIHKAAMMFERKARRERHTALSACPLFYYIIATRQRWRSQARGAEATCLSWCLLFPLGKRCITEKPVHLLNRRAAILWSPFAYLKKKKSVHLYDDDYDDDDGLSCKERFVLALQSASSCFLFNWQSEQL